MSNAWKITVKAADPQRSMQNARNRAAGKLFEDLIDASCKHYDKSNFAVIEKTPEPMRPTKSLGGGRFIAHFEKKAQPDYKGALHHGRALMFEAKHTSSDKMPQGRVTKEQAERLDRYEEMGAGCFVIAAFDRSGYYRIPWEAWKNMKKIFGKQHVTEADLGKFKVPLRDGVLHFLDDIEWSPE